MTEIVKILAKCESAKDFYAAIPTELRQNIEFRVSLHKFLATDFKAQQVYLNLCREYIPIIFSSTFWTINPQLKPGYRNQPFILRPSQIPAVETMNWCINNGHDVGLNKTRKQGASEICCKLCAAKALLEPDGIFILGSRVKQLVDCLGDPTTLFAKVDNAMDCLPSWLKKLCGYDPKICRKDLQLTVPSTNSVFRGETTNENFSAGSRATVLVLDEFGRVEYNIAESIEGSVHDVSNCVIYSSTHWLGANHTFNKCLKKDSTKVIELMWYTNPEEMAGLYTTDSIGSYKILDEEYYKDKDVDNAIVLESINNYDPGEKRIQFVADGLKGLPSPYRSPWFDCQQKKRQGNKRDFICNIMATPLGASDSPFDQEILEQIRKTSIRPADFSGEINFRLDDSGHIDERSIAFYKSYGERRLKWWGELPFGRPIQSHNYVIGVDPSYGLGSANSAAIILDVNTHEQVGSWVDSTTKPEDFADMMVALAYWIGGTSPTFIIWESNAGCGANFSNRVLYQGYWRVYTQRREDSKTRKKTQKWGWSSNEKAKENILGELGIALSGGLAGDDSYLSMVIHDELLLDELFDYVFKEKGKGIVQSSKADMSTGAAERHGDRGIAAALCILGSKEQPKGDWKEIRNPHPQSFMARYKQWEEEEALKKQNARRHLY